MKLIKALASLKITVACLMLGIVLVFIGTLAQQHQATVLVQKEYFESFIVFRHFPRFGIEIPIFLGGFSIGALLLINLLASMITDLHPKRKRYSLLVIHAGLVLLLVGMLLNSILTRESYMELNEGQTKNYTESSSEFELAFVRDVDKKTEEVTSIPLSSLRPGKTVATDSLPFEIEVVELHPNSRLVMAENAMKAGVQGAGASVAVHPLAIDPTGKEQNLPTVVFDLKTKDKKLGRWIGSNATLWMGNQWVMLPEQHIAYDGVEYRFRLRYKRSYEPYSIRLNDFQHERYPGTNIPKSFASEVTIMAPGEEPRDTKIYMNHPLRYGGKAYYQASFKNNDKTSVLMVVRNPSWQLPYIACIVIFVGLMGQFIGSLRKYLKTRRERQSTAIERPILSSPQQLWAWGLLALFAIPIVITFLPKRTAQGYHIAGFASLPVRQQGRIKPLDSIARHALFVIQGKQKVKWEGRKRSASEWLLDMWAHPAQANQWKVFRIDSPAVLSYVGIEQQGRYYSFDQLIPSLNKLKDPLQEKNDKMFAREVQSLQQKTDLYMALQNSVRPATEPRFQQHLLRFERGHSTIVKAMEKEKKTGKEGEIGQQTLSSMQTALTWARQMSDIKTFDCIPAKDGDWDNPGQAIMSGFKTGSLPPELMLYQNLIVTRERGDIKNFNETLVQLHGRLPVRKKAGWEYLYNRTQPFKLAMVMYILVFVLSALAWLKWPCFLNHLAFMVAIQGFIIHTIGILWRSWLHGYVPVTNLYSTAIVVGWGAVLIGILLERNQRSGIGNICSAIIGFITLIIAHHLAQGNDTMEMLRAVLNNNMWLTSHVFTIIIGYSSAFLAGTMGICYVVRRLAKGDDESGQALGRMVYGIICFCLFFSFIGTVLGGMWADQSWGRFWGWDPKENGALLVVTWAALILHAKAIGLIKVRGTMVLAIIGNMITGFSWFGVNLMGVGLHSYGFMEGGMMWFLLFECSQLLFVITGLLPSFNSQAEPAAELTTNES